MKTSPGELLTLAGLAAGSGLAWYGLLRRRERAGTPIAYEPRRTVPWDIAALGGAVLIFVAVRTLSVAIAEWHLAQDEKFVILRGAVPVQYGYWRLPEYATTMFQAAAGSQTLIALAVALMLIFSYGATRDDLGLSPRRLGYDLRLGLVGFLAFAAPAVLLQSVLQTYVSFSKHPIVLALELTTDRATIFWAGMAAVAVAPWAEEFLFRGVLQGFLERLMTSPPEYAPAADGSAPIARDAPSSFAPIVASASIFALMHWSSGIDVVPLFFLALGLGYLYRQTHRLWPGIVVHTLLNAFSMAALLYQPRA